MQVNRACEYKHISFLLLLQKKQFNLFFINKNTDENFVSGICFAAAK